jgi:hypothetical protein
MQKEDNPKEKFALFKDFVEKRNFFLGVCGTGKHCYLVITKKLPSGSVQSAVPFSSHICWENTLGEMVLLSPMKKDKKTVFPLPGNCSLGTTLVDAIALFVKAAEVYEEKSEIKEAKSIW